MNGIQKKSQEECLCFLHSSPNNIQCGPHQIIPKIACACCQLATKVGSTSSINLLPLYYCSWTVAILPSWVFYRSIFQSYGTCKTLLCEFRQAKKKISHVSSIPAALLGFLFAIKLFLILTVVLLFARKIIILSRCRDISLFSHVVSDGLNKYPLHKAHRVGRKGIS